MDKPAGMSTHPSLGHPTGTLANVFAAMPDAKGRAFRPLGRLDRDTSGLVVAAMHPHAAHRLAKRMQKTYLAVVGGAMTGTGRTDAPIFTDPATPRRTTDALGQAAATRWRVLFTQKDRALVALAPETGRTHQLRVHMAHVGHPLLGDALYGGEVSEINRHALHCAHLRVMNYFGEGAPLVVSSPLPADMAALLEDGAKGEAALFLADMMKGEKTC